MRACLIILAISCGMWAQTPKPAAHDPSPTAQTPAVQSGTGETKGTVVKNPDTPAPAGSPTSTAPLTGTPAAASAIGDKLPPGLTVSEASYPLPPDLHAQAREVQYNIDQTEILIQQHLVEVEKLRAKETEMWTTFRGIAFDFATKKGIPLDLYTIDANKLSFIKNKPVTIGAGPGPAVK